MDVTFSCVSPIIDNEFLHNIVKVVCGSPRGPADNFDNVMTKFIVYNRTDESVIAPRPSPIGGK